MRTIIFSGTMLLVFAAPAGASNLDLYSAEMKNAQQNLALALFASTCGLRSAEWFGAWRDIYQTFAIREANRLHLSRDEVLTAESRGAKIQDEIRRKSTCESLAASGVLDELDGIERRSTGNYH